MEGINLTNWEFHTVEEIVNPERYLIEPAKLLDELGVKWCFGFGTAIGFYRDGTFPKGDTDVDILIYADGIDTERVVAAFKDKYTYIRTVSDKDRQYQSAFQGEDGFIVDICFFYQDSDKFVSYCEGGKWEDGVDTIGSLQMIETKYGSFPFPEKIEEYLTARYGDWQTPQYGAITSSIKICE